MHHGSRLQVALHNFLLAPATKSQPEFGFLKHFDYGLLREKPGTGQYDMLS